MTNKRYGSFWNILEAWMKSQQGLSQKTSVQVGVNFSRGNAFMSQHFLNSSQVCAPFHQVGRKGMSESMW